MTAEMQPFEPIERMLESLNVNSVFGSPLQSGNLTLIPVAQVSVGFGYGFGSEAGAEAPEGAGDRPNMGGGGGGGGGAGGRARPLGVIRAAPDGVQFEPMVDVPRMGIAGIVLAGWIVFWVAQTIMAFRRGR